MPARTMVFNPAPRRESSSAAAVRDTGIVIRLMSAVRHERKNAPNIDSYQQQGDQQRDAEGADLLLR